MLTLQEIFNIPYLKALKAEKKALFSYGMSLKRSSIRKKKFHLELKNASEPCDCRELVIIFIFIVQLSCFVIAWESSYSLR